ncbi:MAG: response regulator [Roseomonas sp.]|nr:response regulator [Roseomonas sp.]
MTITLPQYPPAERLHASEGRAWLEWNADTDDLQFSAAALDLLHLKPSEAPQREAELVAVFKAQSQSKLAIALEDILTQGECRQVELLRKTPAGVQLVLFSGHLDVSRPGRLVIATFEDITTSSHGQQHLAARARFQTFVNLLQQDPAFFDSVPLGLMMVTNGFITQANPKLAEILATPTTNLVGEPVSRILSDKQGYDFYMETVLGDGSEHGDDHVETEFESEAGTPIWLKLSISRIASGDADNACLCMIEDITTRKKLEQDVWNGLAETISAKEATENAARAKDEFLAMVSHEIRTPLSAVIGMQRLALRDPELQEKTRKHLDLAQTNAEFLLELLNDILDFSKIEAGKLVLESVDFSLRNLVGDSVALLAERAEAKNISLDVGIDDEVPDTLEGDPARIKQILLNLIGNGIKFTDHGGVTLKVAPQKILGGDCRISFVVSDTGIGISPDGQSRLFRKFTQGDTSTTRRFGGTGLGLAICKQIVDLMQGEIHLSSEVGTGTCFTFTIPFRLGTNQGKSLQVQLQPHTHQLQILCAEDFLPNQLIIQGLLEEMGHRAEFVENGQKALEALPLRSFDLILMDGRMPEMDGATAIRLIRSGGDGRFHIPDPKIHIIMLTANAGDDNRQYYLSCGADDFLAKPVDEALLHQSLTRVMDARLAEGAKLLPLLRNHEEELAQIFGAPLPEADPARGAKLTGHVKSGHQDAVNLKERLKQALREDLQTRIRALDAAHAKQDLHALGQLFHSLKGSVGFIWPEGDLVKLSAELERLADHQEWDAITREIPHFRAMLMEIAKGADT